MIVNPFYKYKIWHIIYIKRINNTLNRIKNSFIFHINVTALHNKPCNSLKAYVNKNFAEILSYLKNKISAISVFILKLQSPLFIYARPFQTNSIYSGKITSVSWLYPAALPILIPLFPLLFAVLTPLRMGIAYHTNTFASFPFCYS